MDDDDWDLPEDDDPGDEHEDWLTHPSLTAAERNPSLCESR